MSAEAPSRPRILVTGFGPFPGAPDNPTETLARCLAKLPPEDVGAAALRAIVLPTDYRKSWPSLRRVQARFDPDIVVHFGLAMQADCIRLERFARKRVDPEKPDAAGFAPASAKARRSGPDIVPASLPEEPIRQALRRAGIPAELSDDAGAYVCNATLYRSLCAVPAGSRRIVGFVHVPPECQGDFTAARLLEAGRIVLTEAASAWSEAVGQEAGPLTLPLPRSELVRS